MAYVTGFFAADGYITANKRGANFWNIKICDKDLLYKIRNCIGSEHKIGVRKHKNINAKLQYCLQIGSKEMCNDLRSLGFSENKTKSLVVPNIPDRYLAAFVRGYFDGDGNVWVGYTHKERINKLCVIRSVFTSCSLNFLETIKMKLEKFYICKGVVSKGKGNYYRLTYSIHNSLKLYNFMYNKRAFNTKDLFLARKKKVFESYVKLRL